MPRIEYNDKQRLRRCQRLFREAHEMSEELRAKLGIEDSLDYEDPYIDSVELGQGDVESFIKYYESDGDTKYLER